MGTRRAPNPPAGQCLERAGRRRGPGQGEGPGLEPDSDLILKNASWTHTQRGCPEPSQSQGGGAGVRMGPQDESPAPPPL